MGVDDGYANLLGVFFRRRKQPLFLEAAVEFWLGSRGLYCPARISNWTQGNIPPSGHLGILWTTTMSSTLLLLPLMFAFIFAFVSDF
jgi:hypothetical protein